MSILDFAPPQPSITPRLTAQDFLALYPETLQPLELIEGKVIELASPGDVHQHVSMQLGMFLNLYNLQMGLGVVRAAPLDVLLDEWTIVQPDLFFVAHDNPRCRLGDDSRWQGSPDLCVEILSSNVRHDRLTKRALYEQFGVKEYWIVDPVGRYIEIHHLQEERLQVVALFQNGDTLESPLLPGFKLELKQVFPPQ
jgi:Uma2 family endonuclease